MGMITPHEVFEENKIEPGEPPRHSFSAAKVRAKICIYFVFAPQLT